MTGEQDREAAFLAELAALTRRYRERLSGFTAQAQALARELEKGRDPAVRRELRRLLHSLAGTAPTYGFPGAGRAARAAMALLGAEDESSRLPDPGEMDRALKALHAAVETEAPEA